MQIVLMFISGVFLGIGIALKLVLPNAINEMLVKDNNTTLVQFKKEAGYE